jgi:hypothetical protein
LHQELLLALQIEFAKRVFSEYVALLELRMRHEERLLLPEYAACGAEPTFPVVLYTGQHRKMLEHLSAIRAKLDALV